MARKRITEYRAKQLVYPAVGQSRLVVAVTDDSFSLDELPDDQTYVVKVDQGVKKRWKQGLIKLQQTKQQLSQALTQLRQTGYGRFLIEPMVDYPPELERYWAMWRTRDGTMVQYSIHGGVEIEQRADEVTQELWNSDTAGRASQTLGVSQQFLTQLNQAFDRYHFAFLEINPLVVKQDKPYLIDLAVEVDTAGQIFCLSDWSKQDFVSGRMRQLTQEEQIIQQLAEQSQASFKFELFNPHGRVFVLLSGGGASITLADEFMNLGQADQLANYGEYSGNPSQEETYIYSSAVLDLLLKSQAQNKRLMIAGAVANFTDVAHTFAGIIQAMDERVEQMRHQKIKVYVRRGGPNQTRGLAMMEDFLRQHDILGVVAGPEMMLTEIVKLTL